MITKFESHDQSHSPRVRAPKGRTGSGETEEETILKTGSTRWAGMGVRKQ